MGLKTQQGIIIYSPDILNGEKLQALIKQITPDFITIFIPINNIAINTGIDISVNFWDNHATYEFQTKSLNSKGITEDSLNIARPTTLSKVMNRSFPRVVVKTAGQMFDDLGFNGRQCLIIDLSGGGVLVTSKINKNVNDPVKLTFMLPNGENFENINGLIVWKKEISPEIFNYGIEFDKISDIRRQKIVSFINSEIVNKKNT